MVDLKWEKLLREIQILMAKTKNLVLSPCVRNGRVCGEQFGDSSAENRVLVGGKFGKGHRTIDCRFDVFCKLEIIAYGPMSNVHIIIFLFYYLFSV